MCGRFAIINQLKKFITKYYLVEPDFIYLPNYNICPGMRSPVLVNSDGGVAVKLYKWGLKFSEKKINLINIRLESLAGNFYKKIINNRCLIFADGFYEWDKNKQPYYFKPLVCDNLLFAGLYNVDYTGEIRYAIITVSANETMLNIHDRMPAILTDDLIDKWFDGNLSVKQINQLCLAAKKIKLTNYKVSKFVNSPVNNSEECIKPNNAF